MKKCQHCNVDLIKKSQNKFCSNRCQLIAQKQSIFEKIDKGVVSGHDPRMFKAYIREHLKMPYCALCSQGEMWNGKLLVLQLDHIDGDSDNNAISNLRLLCPNCHTQTETFGAKGNGSRYRKNTKRNMYLRKYKGFEQD